MIQAVNIFAVLATLALVSVVFRVSWLAIRRTFFESCTKAQECVFFHTQLGHYAACLIIALMFNAVAGIIGIQWYFHGGIVNGRNLSPFIAFLDFNMIFRSQVGHAEPRVSQCYNLS
jgi:hypothetical protein